MSRIDRSQINVSGPNEGFRFQPFRPQSHHEHLLAQAKLADHTELIAFERGGQRRTLVLREMTYHHIAQGELAGEPYLVTF